MPKARSVFHNSRAALAWSNPSWVKSGSGPQTNWSSPLSLDQYLQCQRRRMSFRMTAPICSRTRPKPASHPETQLIRSATALSKTCSITFVPYLASPALSGNVAISSVGRWSDSSKDITYGTLARGVKRRRPCIEYRVWRRHSAH